MLDQYHKKPPAVSIQETEVYLLVCVKPLGHLHSRDTGISPGHWEVGAQANLASSPRVALWDSAKHGRGIKDLVVVREGVAGNVLDPSFWHLLPDARPEVSGNFLQILGAALPIPERLQGKLELPLGAHARVSNNMGRHLSITEKVKLSLIHSNMEAEYLSQQSCK